MSSEECLEALSFASNYLACVQVEGVPVFRHCFKPIGSGNAVAVDACIRISDTLARITVTVPLNWRHLAPWVRCHESWIRRGNPDWHAYEDGGLCYVHNEEWLDQVNIIARECGSGADILPFCAAQCAQSSVQLMERHLLGDRRKHKKWPTSWLAWSHSNIGTNQYRSERPRRISEFSAAYRNSLQAMQK